MATQYEVEVLLKWIADVRKAAELGKEIKADQDKVKALDRQIVELRKSATEQLDKIAGSAKRIGLGMTAVGGAGLFAVGKMMKSAYGAAEAWNEYQDTLEIVLKDQQQVNALMEYTKGISMKIPFDTSDIQEAIKTMTIFGYKPEEWMTTFGDAAKVANVSLSTIADAFGKARATGGQSLRQLTSMLGITQAQLEAFGWKGKAEDVLDIKGVEQFEKVLRGIIDTKFGGRMAKEMGEAGSAMQNMKNLWAWIRAEVGKPLFAALGKDLSALRDKIIQLYKTGELQKWVKSIQGAVMNIYNAIKWLAGIIWKVAKPFLDFLGKHPELAKWAIVIGTFTSALILMGGGFLMVGGQITQWIISITKGIGALKSFIATQKTLALLGGAKGGILGGLLGDLRSVETAAGGAAGQLKQMSTFQWAKGALKGPAIAAGALTLAAVYVTAMNVLNARIENWTAQKREEVFTKVGRGEGLRAADIYNIQKGELGVRVTRALSPWNLLTGMKKDVSMLPMALPWTEANKNLRFFANELVAAGKIKKWETAYVTTQLGEQVQAFKKEIAAAGQNEVAVRAVQEKYINLWGMGTEKTKKFFRAAGVDFDKILKSLKENVEAAGKPLMTEHGLLTPTEYGPNVKEFAAPTPVESPISSRGGGGGGGGGATINNTYWYLTQHFEDGSVGISAQKVDAEDLKRLMRQIIREESPAPIPG